MNRFVALLAGLLLTAPAMAQDAPVDPRLVGPVITAARAQLALLDAALKASIEDAKKREDDMAKREADLAVWFKGWFGSENDAGKKAAGEPAKG